MSAVCGASPSWAKAIASTTKTSSFEGLWVRCGWDPWKINYHLQINPNAASEKEVVIAAGAEAWFYATVVWPVGAAIKVMGGDKKLVIQV